MGAFRHILLDDGKENFKTNRSECMCCKYEYERDGFIIQLHAYVGFHANMECKLPEKKVDFFEF